MALPARIILVNAHGLFETIPTKLDKVLCDTKIPFGDTKKMRAWLANLSGGELNYDDCNDIEIAIIYASEYGEYI